MQLLREHLVLTFTQISVTFKLISSLVIQWKKQVLSAENYLHLQNNLTSSHLIFLGNNGTLQNLSSKQKRHLATELH